MKFLKAIFLIGLAAFGLTACDETEDKADYSGVYTYRNDKSPFTYVIDVKKCNEVCGEHVNHRAGENEYQLRYIDFKTAEMTLSEAMNGRKYYESYVENYFVRNGYLYHITYINGVDENGYPDRYSTIDTDDIDENGKPRVYGVFKGNKLIFDEERIYTKQENF